MPTPAAPPVLNAAPVPRSKRAVFARRALSAVILWAVLFGTLISGQPVCYFLLTASFALFGLWEFYRMLDHKGLPLFKALGMVCAAVFLVGSFSFLNFYPRSELANGFEIVVMLAFLVVAFGRQIFVPSRGGKLILEPMAYTLFGLVYVPWLFNFIAKIIYLVPRDADGGLMGQYYVLYLIVVAKFSDMGAYLTGSLIGKHKMAPHISPGKTWEGFGGALGFSLLASFGLWALMPPLHLLHPLDCLLLGLGLSVVAVIGDLAESILKRTLGVKDSGTLLPGIGGILDLIDSLLFTAPLLYFYLYFILWLRQ